MISMHSLRSLYRRFSRDESGTTSLEFVLVFPVFFGMFLMTYESGMISARHVMLERGVDITIREVRIGALAPDRDRLRDRICEIALIIPDCASQLAIEMIQRNPMAWVAVNPRVQCVNRGDVDADPPDVDDIGNNELMILRACLRIDPFLPTSGIGKAIVQNNSGSAADGSHALVSMGAFVVEPFMADPDA